MVRQAGGQLRARRQLCGSIWQLGFSRVETLTVVAVQLWGSGLLTHPWLVESRAYGQGWCDCATADARPTAK